MSEVLLEVEGLGKRYDDAGRSIEVLAGLDLRVAVGERVAVVGESGVGKSTLLHLLGALDVPTSGRIRFAGRDLATLTPAEVSGFRNREIGFVFQFHHLLPDFSAEENVMMPARIAGESREKATEVAREILDRVGLDHRRSHKPGELSGGEQQRVSVARAVVMRPRLLLADEPTGNLDPATGAEVHALLSELNAERGLAMVVATHNPSLAAALDRRLRLSAGRLESDDGAPIDALGAV